MVLQYYMFYMFQTSSAPSRMPLWPIRTSRSVSSAVPGRGLSRWPASGSMQNVTWSLSNKPKCDTHAFTDVFFATCHSGAKSMQRGYGSHRIPQILLVAMPCYGNFMTHESLVLLSRFATIKYKLLEKLNLRYVLGIHQFLLPSSSHISPLPRKTPKISSARIRRGEKTELLLSLGRWHGMKTSVQQHNPCRVAQKTAKRNGAPWQ